MLYELHDKLISPLLRLVMSALDAVIDPDPVPDESTANKECFVIIRQHAFPLVEFAQYALMFHSNVVYH